MCVRESVCEEVSVRMYKVRSVGCWRFWGVLYGTPHSWLVSRVEWQSGDARICSGGGGGRVKGGRVTSERLE